MSLAGVQYTAALLSGQRWLHTRLHRWVSAVFSLRAPRRLRAISNAVAGLQPYAVLTVAHGYSCITAAYARRHRLPPHFIEHDDWPRMVCDVPPVCGWVDRQFVLCCREAADALEFSVPSARLAEDHLITVGLAGSV